MPIFVKRTDKTPHDEKNDFVVGVDSFEDVQIDPAPTVENLWYFKNTRKQARIRRFILENSVRVEKACVVTLVKKNGEKFSPRFDFFIWNTSKKAYENFSRQTVDDILIKGKVSLDSCHQAFAALIGFVNSFTDDIEFSASSYALVDRKKKSIYDDVSKDVAISGFAQKFGDNITEKDVSLLQNRRSKLEYFRALLEEESFFENEKKARYEKTGKIIRNEDLWQTFFEQNPWVFGYGLQLISCESLDDRKLEQIVSGADVISGSGKRIDALLKTKGSISKILFCEIKTHAPGLLVEEYDRPGVFVPGKELRGAVAQIQKTIHKTTLRLTTNFFRPSNQSGDPSGEEILFVKPKGVVVIGKLDDFKTDQGINYEKLSSFELYRQQISGIEVITFDELYERVRFIVQQ